ncbi:MAG: DUF72 domain-containing protein [Bdellovibrionales bacterium]|nr:DUF72 domain-containing protein [Bdellovibrionales bacterium]
MSKQIHVGTAHWQMPKQYSHGFLDKGSHLERYASVLNAVEINSSFYKEHQQKTYERWRDSVPADFKFSVKVSHIFTHELELNVSFDLLKESISRILALQSKLGVLLVQLPPHLDFKVHDVADFFNKLRKLYHGPIAVEPRHYTWLRPEALELMRELKLSKVFADPAPCPLELKDSPLSGVTYFRLHGTPVIYKSDYPKTLLQELARDFKELPHKNIWCVFDNTTYGYATKNALDLSASLGLRSVKSRGDDLLAWLNDLNNQPPDSGHGLL